MLFKSLKIYFSDIMSSSIVCQKNQRVLLVFFLSFKQNDTQHVCNEIHHTTKVRLLKSIGKQKKVFLSI